MTVEREKKKSLFYLLCFARGVTQCIAQDVRRLIITLLQTGLGREGKVAACTRPPRPMGQQPLRGAPGPPGASRGCAGQHVAFGCGHSHGALVPQIRCFGPKLYRVGLPVLSALAQGVVSGTCCLPWPVALVSLSPPW